MPKAPKVGDTITMHYPQAPDHTLTVVVTKVEKGPDGLPFLEVSTPDDERLRCVHESSAAARVVPYWS